MEFYSEEEVKNAAKNMEELQSKCFMINAQLTSESIKWLQERHYYIEIYKGVTMVARNKEDLPTKKQVDAVMWLIAQIF